MDWSWILSELKDLWPHLVALVSLIVAALASAHVVMWKRHSRAAIGWVGVIWLAPIVGATLYVIFGINRLQRRAHKVRRGPRHGRSATIDHACMIDPLRSAVGEDGGHLVQLARLVGRLSARPVLEGNRITPLVGGDEGYPAMLSAIENARGSISLSSYIFNNDRAGQKFITALGAAVARGVQVRVLVDDIGARYAWPSVERPLKAVGVQFARFLPSFVPGWSPYSNLRSHRKLLIVDGRLGFTGGLNIREGHWLALQPKHAIQDLHFKLEGPIVAHLQEVFLDDWAFCTGELLQTPELFPVIERAGDTLARGISAGPDSDYDKLHIAMLGAVSCAQRSIAIITPYFLPDAALIMALNVAALRGVHVDIILPERNNLILVQWASTAMLWQLLEHGCHIWVTPPPFDHTKLMVVDQAWTLFGSANWDPRSLRLNFEFDVECYDRELAAATEALVVRKRQQARPITLADVDGRSYFVRLRDGIARLFTPYL